MNKNEQLAKEEKEFSEYYSKIFSEILHLYQNHKFEESLKILDEEINQPYVPSEYLSQMLDLKNDVEKTLGNESFKEKFQNMSKLQIWNEIYDEDKNKLNISYFELLIEKYNETLDEMDITIIQKIFLNKKISNYDKVLIIQLICDLKVEHTFEIYNEYLDKISVFSPIEYLDTTLSQLKEISDAISQIYLQDPTKTEIASNLLYVLHIKLMPGCINFNIHDIINTLKNITNSFFSEEVIEDNQITEMLSDFIKIEEDE
ncbi:MAG: DUF3196 family protein [Mycoplasma sp.]